MKEAFEDTISDAISCFNEQELSQVVFRHHNLFRKRVKGIKREREKQQSFCTYRLHAMELSLLVPLLYILACFLGNATSVKTMVKIMVKTDSVFYMLGSDGIYVIDPVSKHVVTKITNTSSPGLCTQSNNRYSKKQCALNSASVVGDKVYVADDAGSAVHLIDVKTQKKVESIRTDPYPFGLQFLPWRQEVWVHSWNLSTFDVIETKDRTRTHTAVRAHTTPGWTHGIMVSHEEMLQGNVGYVTHFSNPGVHKINLKAKSYSGFLNFTAQGCQGTYGIAFNPYNDRLYVDCTKRYRRFLLLEINIEMDEVVKTWPFPGFPFVSPNGRYVVVLYAAGNTSRMNILALTGSKVVQYPELRIPGGVSHAVFYSKGKNSASYKVFVTLDYSNKIAVVDLDLAKDGNISDVTYIENVGMLDRSLHGASRDLFIHDKWVISPATKSKTVVIINAETEKLHGTISGVNGGRFAVWVGESSTGCRSGIDHSSILIVLLTFLYFILQ